MKRLFIPLLFLISFGHGAPVTAEKMAFTLAEPDDVVKAEKPKGFLRVLQEISENSYVKDFMSLLDIVGSAAASSSSTPSPSPLPVARGVRTQSDTRRVAIPVAQTSFERSLSMDDAPRRIQSDEMRAPADGKTISKEDWAQTLFGERGVLTGIFQMMDQQRKASSGAHHTQSDSATINGKKFDLKEVFDALLTGKKGELGDPGAELPEFLGICNRLSCGDIYKAIDKFRRSEFFSNFQTAMSLVQDPNGWETIGKLLSNPELISQFTGGSGMEQLFGSALGEAKKESNKTNVKNSKLLPEDGDFGIDFSEDGEDKKENKMPDIDFSVDAKPETSDYYEEVVKGTSIGTDEETVDVAPPPPPPPAPVAKMTKPQPMPDLSFSIDEATEEETEAQTIVDIAPPTKAVGTSAQKPLIITTTTRATTTRSRTTPRPTTRWTPPTTTRPTTTPKNLRKESDYYAMYYDDQPR